MNELLRNYFFVRLALPKFALLLIFTLISLSGCERQLTQAADSEMNFKQIPLQFIAALGEPDANSGTGAENWAIWPIDPGPRGVRLGSYDRLQAAGGVAPAGWRFDASDWWLEENGLIMEPPDLPVAPGSYMVTGDREVTTVLTVFPPDPSGAKRWELADGATLYDVTHLGCRSARYSPMPGSEAESCSPANAPQEAFRVSPGADMPPVNGCQKQDYAVLFLVAIES
jgi:hypothetical protein